LLHGVKSGKIAGTSGEAVELFAIGIDFGAELSEVGFAATLVCVAFATTLEDAIGTSGSNFVIGTGIATKVLELIVLGKDEVVATLFDTDVPSRSSILFAKLGIVNDVLGSPATVLAAEAFIGKVHIARACDNI